MRRILQKRAVVGASVWVALIALAVVLCYFPSLRGKFLWDDDRLAANPFLGMPGALARIWTPGGMLQFYPVTFTSFWIERRLWGLDPIGFHCVNLALHVANALLAAVCLKRLGARAAWLAALLFAIHPVHAESVAWLAERKNLLSAFFYLLSLSCWLLHDEDGRKGAYAASLAFFSLAMLSKTTACTLPAAIVLLRWAKGRPVGRRAGELVPFFLIAAAGASLTAAVERALSLRGMTGFDLSWVQKIVLAPRSLWFHVTNLLWPTALSFSYPHWRIDAWDPRQWLAPALTIGFAAILWAWRKRMPRGAAAGLGFYTLTLLPALGFLPVYTFRFSYVADHYQYLASLGLIWLVAEALWLTPGARRLAGALVAALCLLTRAQAQHYVDSQTLWRHAAASSPDSALARNNYGVFLRDQGRLDAAAEHFDAALRLMPEFEDAEYNRGRTLSLRGDARSAESSYRRAIELQPNHVLARTAMGQLLNEQGRFQESIEHFMVVLRLRPADGPTYNNLGVALGRTGRPHEAIECFQRALELDPGSAAARRNLDLALGAR
jgi:protein O-mannosyl-transferase